MNSSSFGIAVQNQIEKCMEVLDIKGIDYDMPDASDKLQVFKTAAALQQTSPEQALAGMLAKHIVSIFNMCSTGCEDKDKWNEKITDAINYLLILSAMVKGE